MALTKRQREIFNWIERFIKTSRYSPSFDEIRVGVGLSSYATVHKHLKNLEGKGMITRDYNRSRSIDITHRAVMVPKTCPHCNGAL